MAHPWEREDTLVTDVWDADNAEEHELVGFDTGAIADVEGGDISAARPALALALDDGQRLVLRLDEARAMRLAARLIATFMHSSRERDMFTQALESFGPGSSDMP